MTARTARRTNRWSNWRRSARCPAWWCCGRPTPTRWSRPIATSCSCGTSRRRWCCRVNPCRRSTATSTHPASGVARGAYVLADAPDGKPEVILIASGSEVALAVACPRGAACRRHPLRVVSMPSWEIFEHQRKHIGQRAAAERDGARCRGAGLDLWLGALRRLVRPESSACIHSVRRPRSRSCNGNSGSSRIA